MSDTAGTGVTVDDINSLNGKLVAFATGLTPSELAAFGNLMEGARASIDGDVSGYDDRGLAGELLTGISWDVLTGQSPSGTSGRIQESGHFDKSDTDPTS